jgi:hypothetical protein
MGIVVCQKSFGCLGSRCLRRPATGGRLCGRISPPHETYENAVRIGWSGKLEDKGREVDANIDFKTTSLSLVSDRGGLQGSGAIKSWRYRIA